MNAASLQGALRSLPQVEEVLNSPTVRAAAEGAPRALAVEAVRASIEQARSAILDGSADAADVSAIEAAATAAIRKAQAPSLRRVVNATGVVVHTNLGRSVLAPSAVKAAARVAGGYSTLEYDAETLSRGSRHAHCERLLCMLTGAEDAIAVNNNAAAVLLVLSCFGRGRQAVVSRGELVEIGGSFRIPDIMELSGAQMVEVGTTNKTHPSDYERALGAQTGLLVKVHPSNFRMEGFTESVGVKELAALAQRENAARRELDPACDPVLVYEDQGSGALLPLDVFGEGDEPTPAESLKAGCDLVSFSGDKLLGGPQAGIIAGSAKLIAQLKAHPLARALRLDKMTLAALEETLRLYLDPEKARREIPTLSMLGASKDALLPRAQKLAAAIERAMPASSAEVAVVDETSRAGGGALPMRDIPTCAVQVRLRTGDAQSCERSLAAGEVPVVARIKHDAVLFDVRTLVDDGEIGIIASALTRYLQEVEG